MRNLKSTRLSALTALALALTACGNANSTEAQPTQNTTDVMAEQSLFSNWEIVKDSSHIHFSALQEGEAFSGAFEDFSGTINFDPDALGKANIRIEIPLTSVDAGSNDRNSTVPGKVWFSTKAFPIAVFETQDVKREGEGYVANGTLSLKGASNPVTLEFDLKIDGDQADMTGKAVIDRTLWGVGAAPWDTDEYVSRSVEIDVKVTATRK